MNNDNKLIQILKKIGSSLSIFFAFLWKKKIQIFIGSSLLIFGIFFFLLGGSYVAWTQEKPQIVKNLDKFSSEINTFNDQIRPDPIKIVDKKGLLIGEFFRSEFRPIRTDNLKDFQVIVWALLSMEDRSFFNHSGVNWSAIARAFIINITKGRISQGGSTITQQLAKLTLDLGKRSLFNKLTEFYATFYIESRFSKEEILAMYLNQIFLGQDNTGVESAARYYFDKSAKDLSVAEAAMIVGTIPAPSLYNPVRNLRIALARQRLVMVEMSRNTDSRVRPKGKQFEGFETKIIDSIQKFRAKYKVEETVEEGKPTRYSSNIAARGYDRNFRLNLAPDFNIDIRKFVIDNYSEEELSNRSITVHTTLDYEKQMIAQAALREGIDNIRNNIVALGVVSKKNPKPINQKIVNEIADGMRSSFVSINPNNGDVEVFLNSLRISRSYRPNRIETSFRQPGSTIKALIYALAYERRMVNPSSVVVDEKISFNGYAPKNWYAGYKGEVTVRRSIAQSMNTIPVKFLREMGVDSFLDKLAEILSLEPEETKKRFNRNLSLALGSGELTPMELAVVYATLQNGGKKVVPRKILKITDSNALDDFSFIEPTTYQVLDPVACAMAIDSISAVLTSEGTMPIRLTGDKRFPMGGKTGTVQSPAGAREKWGNISGVRDAWFAGALPGQTSVVWIGNEWGAPFPGSGSGTTGRVWWQYAQALNNRTPITEKSLMTEEIQGNYLKLDVCTDDGTQLENDWDKEFITLAIPSPTNLNSDPDLNSDPNPNEESPAPELDINSRDMKKRSQNAEKTTEENKVKNPRYCKLPAFAQYYYIGEGAQRRKITEPIFTDEGVLIASREGVSEINVMDTSETAKIEPGLTDPFAPVREGAVELDEPFMDTPYSDSPYSNSPTGIPEL
ncbi:MAG: penicillin-binding protein [Leptospira sp.]|nr:penicillin-binding protein [Leptospira sp.]